MAVKYYTDDCIYRLPQKRLTAAWLHDVAAAEGYELGDVNYIFCSAQRLLEMNRQFLGHDYFTDIITFDYSDRTGTGIVGGDLFIDVETVADNARQYGFTPLQEMRRVVVHGVLHLCGQGDKTPRTNAQMHRKEDKYLCFWGQRPATPGVTAQSTGPAQSAPAKSAVVAPAIAASLRKSATSASQTTNSKRGCASDAQTSGAARDTATPTPTNPLKDK